MKVEKVVVTLLLIAMIFSVVTLVVSLSTGMNIGNDSDKVQVASVGLTISEPTIKQNNETNDGT